MIFEQCCTGKTMKSFLFIPVIHVSQHRHAADSHTGEFSPPDGSRAQRDTSFYHTHFKTVEDFMMSAADCNVTTVC